jgi:hypothetical protein
MAYNVDEKYIALTEQKLGILFPESYRNSIMKINGGIVMLPSDESDEDLEVWPLYRIYDNSDKKRLKRTAIDLIRENELAWNQYNLPKHLYAIGYSDGAYLVFKKGKDVKLEPALYIHDMLGYHRDLELTHLVSDFSELAHEN